MTREQFQQALIKLAGKDKELAAIGPFETLTARQTATILNIPMDSLVKGRQGSDVLSKIDVSCHGARRRTFQYNKREVIALQRIRQQPKASAREIAARIYDRI
jgi:hypothetical protein